MKKASYMLLMTLLVMTTAATAQSPENSYGIKETVVYSFNKIVVNANIDVVLVQNDSLPRVYAEGEKQLLSEITFKTVNNSLIVGSTRERSYKGKVLVTIPVKKLVSIEVNSDAAIACVNVLQSPMLVVKANNGCDVKIKSKGKVSFETGEGYYIQHMRQSELKISQAEEITGG